MKKAYNNLDYWIKRLKKGKIFFISYLSRYAKNNPLSVQILTFSFMMNNIREPR